MFLCLGQMNVSYISMSGEICVPWMNICNEFYKTALNMNAFVYSAWVSVNAFCVDYN